MSAVLTPPATKTRVAVSAEAMAGWTARFPDYRAGTAAPALAHAAAVQAL